MTDSDIQAAIHDMGRKARAASRELVKLTSAQKNDILRAMADGLIASEAAILEANTKDIANAEANGLSKAMIDRLLLNPKRLAAIAQAVREVADLPDPVGEVLTEWTRPNGLRIVKKRVPIGVIGIIFESRPQRPPRMQPRFASRPATPRFCAVARKRSTPTNALAAALQDGGAKAGLPANSVQLIPFTDRSSVEHMAKMDQFIDLIIPRGGKGLIEKVVSTARMPVIKHYDGVCHVYVHPDADLDMAANIVINSKTQKARRLQCAGDTAGASRCRSRFLSQGCGETSASRCRNARRQRGPASSARWHQSRPLWKTGARSISKLILSMKTVGSVEEAIEHINSFGFASHG